MNFKELVLKNRSYRSFDKTKRIKREDLEYMVDLARVTASTANLQALKHRIVYEEAECDSTFACTKWAGYLKDMKIPPENCDPTGYVVICCDTDISSNVTPFYKDTGIAAQTILLAATELGYGGCMIGSVDEEKLSAALNLGENLKITLVVALGAPNEKIELTEACGDIKYYRENNVHYVPKRSLSEVLIGGEEK